MKHALFWLLTSGLMVGCAPTLAPHIPYLPAVRTKGEVEVGGTTGLTGNELTIGYQATSRLVLNSSLLYLNRPKSGKDYLSGEVGVGYYWPQTAGRWRLGGHAGLAYGGGRSGTDNFCIDKCSNELVFKSYDSRYAYAYVQPTALLVTDEATVGFGLRIGRTHYNKLEENIYMLSVTPSRGDSTSIVNHAGHGSTFMQPIMQVHYRPRPWLALSGGMGFQFFLNKRTPLNNTAPFIGQVGLHFVLGSKTLATGAAQ